MIPWLERILCRIPAIITVIINEFLNETNSWPKKEFEDFFEIKLEHVEFR